MRLYLYFFLSGIGVGFSFCLLSCGILLFPVVGEGSLNYKSGLLKGLIFNSGKVLAYTFYGGLASYSHSLLKSFTESKYSFFAGGIFLILYGIWFFFKSNKKFCSKKYRKFEIPTFFLGLFYGLIPCGPLVSFCFYVFYVSKGILSGIISGFLFGMGTTIGPLSLCLFFPYLWKIFNRPSFRIYLRLVSSLIFIFWGVNLFTIS